MYLDAIDPFRSFGFQTIRSISGMSILVRTTSTVLAPPVHHSLMPHWLTHLGALGLFSVAVVDSSPIPLPLPGSTDLLLLWLVAYGGDPWLLAAFAIAGQPCGRILHLDLGRRGGEAALRRYVPARLLGESSDGWSVTASLPCFFPPCFLRRFRFCHLRLPLARWASRAAASWSSTARLEPCVTLSLPGSAWSMDATPSACGRGRSRSGQLR